MNKILLFILFATLIFLSVDKSFALTYSESDSGDLNPGIHVGTLDLGTNSVSGILHLDDTVDPMDTDFDFFRFTVGSGMVLTSIIFDFSTTYTNAPGGPSGAAPGYR